MKQLTKFDFDQIKEKTREEIEKILMDELKLVSKTDLASMVCKIREKSAREQLLDIKQQTEEDVALVLEIMEVFKDETASDSQKARAYRIVLDFMEETPTIVSRDFLVESIFALEYAAKVEDAYGLDFIMKKRKEIQTACLDAGLRARGLLEHTKFVDKLIEVDAKQGMDHVVKSHIKSAMSLHYGDLVRKVGDASYTYYTASAYEEMYEDAKAKYLESQGEMV